MRTISLAVSEKNYELFRELAKSEGVSIASLIREAMADYVRHGGAQGGDIASGAVRHIAAAGPGRYKIIAEVSELD